MNLLLLLLQPFISSFCKCYVFVWFDFVSLCAKMYYSFKVLFISTIFKSRASNRIHFKFIHLLFHSLIHLQLSSESSAGHFNVRKLIMIKQTARKLIIPSRERMDFMFAIRDGGNEIFQFKQFRFSPKKIIEGK